MQIRKAQMAALDAAAVRAFENRTYQHLQQYFPRHCALLGEDQMRRVIQYGWRKAQSYDFTAECCVRSYIEFMCLLGGHFDTDPLLPWAAEILNDKSQSDQVVRGDFLYDSVWRYIDNIIPDFRDAGGMPRTARFIPELRKLRSVPDDELTPESIDRVSADVMQWIASVFPAKYRYVGDEAVARLVSDGIDAASRHGLVRQRGATLFVVLAFVLGLRFDNDLLLPWASAALNDDKIGDQAQRAAKLYSDGTHFLRRWWDMAPELQR
jgi:hypothetical protein